MFVYVAVNQVVFVFLLATLSRARLVRPPHSKNAETWSTTFRPRHISEINGDASVRSSASMKPSPHRLSIISRIERIEALTATPTEQQTQRTRGCSIKYPSSPSNDNFDDAHELLLLQAEQVAMLLSLLLNPYRTQSRRGRGLGL